MCWRNPGNHQPLQEGKRGKRERERGRRKKRNGRNENREEKERKEKKIKKRTMMRQEGRKSFSNVLLNKTLRK